MERIAFTLPGGRTILVEPRIADRARRQMIKNRDNDRRIARELKEARLLPSFKSGMSSAQSGGFNAPVIERDNRTVWIEEKKETIEHNWTAHLEACGL